DGAGVDDRLVADGHVAADASGEAAELRVRAVVADVHHGAVLDVGAVADADEVDVAADHRERPYRDVVAQHHVADHAGRGVDVRTRAGGGETVGVGAQSGRIRAHAAILGPHPGMPALHSGAWTPSPIPPSPTSPPPCSDCAAPGRPASRITRSAATTCGD